MFRPRQKGFYQPGIHLVRGVDEFRTRRAVLEPGPIPPPKLDSDHRVIEHRILPLIMIKQGIETPVKFVCGFGWWVLAAHGLSRRWSLALTVHENKSSSKGCIRVHAGLYRVFCIIGFYRVHVPEE